MTQDEIIELSVKAGMYRDALTLGRNVELLTAFAKLVAQHEREACAQLCESSPEPDGFDLADRIRARRSNA